MRYQTYNQDGVIKGTEGIAYEKAQAEKYAVPLTEDYVTETIQDVQKLFENPDNIGTDGNEQFLIGDAYWNNIAPREKMLTLIAKAYSKPNEYVGYNSMPDLDVSNGADFYQAMESKRENILNAPSSNLSNEQKDYWRNMASNINMPLKYGYFEGWEIITTSFELLMFAILAICIVIAPVFSGEYQAGTDAVILSGKYGKIKIDNGKNFSFSFVRNYCICTSHYCGVWIAANCIWYRWVEFTVAGSWFINPYPFTFLQATLINVGVIYLVQLAMIGLTLLLSAKMKSLYLVLIVLVPILFIPLFLAPNGTTGIYNLTLFYYLIVQLSPN